MKKMGFCCALLIWYTSAGAQYFNQDIRTLYKAAVAKNDTLQILRLKKEIAGVEMQSIQYSYLPKISMGASYTRLNDDVVFPNNLQQLLMGTQQLLIKEKMGVPFNTALPANVPVQPVAPIQRKNIFKTTLTGQWLLFSGLKVSNGFKAWQHLQQSYSHLAEKQNSKLWLDIAETYDKLALLHNADAIIHSSENILAEQSKLIHAAIANGLATPLDRKKVELAQQQVAIKKLENNSNKTMLLHQLHQLTALPLIQLQLLQPQLQPTTTDVFAPVAERPELKALNEGIAARHYKIKAELADYVPKVAAFGQYEVRKKDLSLFDPQWAIGLRLQWNMFDGLTAKNNARKEALEKHLLEVQRTAVTEQIQLGYTKMQQEYTLATDKIILKKNQVQLATDTYDFANKQYKNGLTTITEVLNALNEVEKARLELQQSIYEQRRAALKAADINGSLLYHL